MRVSLMRCVSQRINETTSKTANMGLGHSKSISSFSFHSISARMLVDVLNFLILSMRS